MTSGVPSDPVTVIIPTRGTGRGLDRAVASALAQQGVEIELVVVADGRATDPRDIAVLDRLEERHTVVEVSHLGHAGQVRNIGLGRARTPWVAFLDDDDWWCEDKLRLQLALAASTGAAIIGSNALCVDQDDVTGPYFDAVPASVELRDLLMTNWFITSSVLVRRQVLQAVGGFAVDADHAQVEDYAAWLKVVAVGRGALHAEPLVSYSTGRSDSLSGSADLSGVEARRRAVAHFDAASRHWNLRLSRRDRAMVRRLLDVSAAGA